MTAQPVVHCLELVNGLNVFAFSSGYMRVVRRNAGVAPGNHGPSSS